MKWFDNISSRAKLFFSFGIFLMLLLVISLTSFNFMKKLEIHEEDLYQQGYLSAKLIEGLHNSVNAITIQTSMLLNQSYSPLVEKEMAEIEQKHRLLIQEITNIKQIVQNRFIAAYLTEIMELITEIKNLENDKIFPLVRTRNFEEARQIHTSIIKERLNLIEATFTQISNEVTRIVNTKRETLNMNLSEQVEINNFTTVASFAVMIVLVFLLYNSLSKPLLNLSEISKTIAKGDLRVSIPTTSRKDEIGNLYNSFSEMVETLKTINGELKDSVNSLSGIIVNIFTSAAQLASSSTETATAITETTATVEEVRQTAAHSNQTAQQVSQRAQSSAEFSERGKKYTQNTSDGINRIGLEMKSITDTIIKLNEQSKAIGEIISSVNDIAEQSNLLAVNASIEAARAGEHGKGFSVVAQEIKNLAEQSKQSTASVKNILIDIQNSINAAVVSSEKASKSVENGITLAKQTGEIIDELALSISSAADAAMQIAASSQEHEIGMNQITTAMESIKIGSIQNASATKELENSAKILKSISEKANEIIERFKI